MTKIPEVEYNYSDHEGVTAWLQVQETQTGKCIRNSSVGGRVSILYTTDLTVSGVQKLVLELSSLRNTTGKQQQLMSVADLYGQFFHMCPNPDPVRPLPSFYLVFRKENS